MKDKEETNLFSQLKMGARQVNVIVMGTSIIQILNGQVELFSHLKLVILQDLQDNFLCQLAWPTDYKQHRDDCRCGSKK